MSFEQDPNEQADISGADLAILVDENRKLRYLLFMGHRHAEYPLCLYGDDGEMTCNVCFCDFKRDSPDELERKMTAHVLKEMSEHTASSDRGLEVPGRGRIVVLMNTKHADPYRAACDLNDQVSSLKQAVVRLVEIYGEAQRGVECGGDHGAMLREHKVVLDAARSMVTPR